MMPPALLGEGSISEKLLDQAVMESDVCVNGRGGGGGGGGGGGVCMSEFLKILQTLVHTYVLHFCFVYQL